MTITESLLQEIDRGREGKSQGYSMGLPKLESVIDGVTKETMYTLGSSTGSGKTSFVLYSFLYRPLMDHLNDDNFRVFYASLEMNANMLFGKLLSIYIFETYGVQLTLKQLLSRKKGYILDDDSYKMVEDSIDWLKKVESKIKVYDKSLNAATLYRLLCESLSKLGTFEETEHRKVFKPNNPDLIYEVVIDHIGLVRPEAGSTKKSEMDKVISYLITLRNMCGISPVIVQQINRDQSNIERVKAGRTFIQLSDFKESSDSTDASEVVMAINNPNRDKLAKYGNYNVKELGDVFRSIVVLKDRYGDCDVEIGCAFYGQVGIFKELPKPDEIYDYEKYKDPEWIFGKDNENNESKSKFSF